MMEIKVLSFEYEKRNIYVQLIKMKDGLILNSSTNSSFAFNNLAMAVPTRFVANQRNS